jgi:hypothetical protein
MRLLIPMMEAGEGRVDGTSPPMARAANPRALRPLPTTATACTASDDVDLPLGYAGQASPDVTTPTGNGHKTRHLLSLPAHCWTGGRWTRSPATGATASPETAAGVSRHAAGHAPPPRFVATGDNGPRGAMRRSRRRARTQAKRRSRSQARPATTSRSHWRQRPGPGGQRAQVLSSPAGSWLGPRSEACFRWALARG